MKKPIAVLRYLLSVHLLALTILIIFRIVLLGTNLDQIAGIENSFYLLLIAMLKGVQFDNVIACYIIALPAFVLFILALMNKIPRLLIISCNVYFIIAYAIIFAISAADIPYFAYFFTHLNKSIFNWVGFEGTAGMIFQESSYYIYFALYIILIAFFGWVVFRFGKKLLNTESKDLRKADYKFYIPLVILIWGICFMGIRGFGRYPIRVSNAYFCENSFVNQLGINPTFFLLKNCTSSWKMKDKLNGLMPAEEAIAYAQKALDADSFQDKKSVINRNVQFKEEAKQHNIVIILLESMSVEYLNMEYQGKTLTPYIHELIDKSYYFDNFYSSGIHTNNGIVSTLYGFPPIFEQTMMPPTPDYYRGLPMTLKEKGYQNYFFLTHDPSYDNMYAFLNENGFEHIYSEPDYPTEKLVNNFGVQDDYLFEFGLDKLNGIARQGKPFLAAFMTVSNHPPYIIPERFKSSGSNENECIIAFADNSLKEFIEGAEKQDWYNNTIFVILGDHGRYLGKQSYEMALTYNHIPLIIHSPLFDDAPKRFEDFGGQIDIFPTVMGLLHQSYENNSLGIDLFREKRPCMYFVSDNHLGCIDDNFFYIYNPENKSEGLYDYRNDNTKDLKEESGEIAKSMKDYAVSMMITADYLIKNKLTK